MIIAFVIYWIIFISVVLWYIVPVIRHGYRAECLGTDGQWEWETNPSSRDDDFYYRYRFLSLDDALRVYNLSLEID